MNASDTALQTAATLLAAHSQGQAQPEPNRLDVTVAVTDLLAAAGALAETHWGYLAAITGLDAGPKAGYLECLYHFCSAAAVLTVRVRLPRDGPVAPSLCGIIPAASLFERELSEMFGVTFSGSPDTARLFLPDDWPAGIYPLRKDAQLPGPAAQAS